MDITVNAKCGQESEQLKLYIAGGNVYSHFGKFKVQKMQNKTRFRGIF